MDQLVEFTKKFHDQYIDAEDFLLTPSDDFRLVGSWDSLTGMAVLVMIKEEYGVDIPIDAFKRCKRVQDVFDFILELKK